MLGVYTFLQRISREKWQLLQSLDVVLHSCEKVFGVFMLLNNISFGNDIMYVIIAFRPHFERLSNDIGMLIREYSAFYKASPKLRNTAYMLLR